MCVGGGFSGYGGTNNFKVLAYDPHLPRKWYQHGRNWGWLPPTRHDILCYGRL